MASEMSAKVMLQQGMHFTGTTASGHLIDMDELEGASGPSPMELMLLGLAGCSAMDVIAILRKKRQPVEGLEVFVSGHRCDEYPRVFTDIELEYVVMGDDVDTKAIERAIELSARNYCPVWAMLGKSAEITSSFKVVSAAASFVPVD
ncbi:MAG: OsmC family protein [Chloroflexales bacterium]|nr:OsmC family protein [Chloroflexales bacterium]